MTNKKYILCIFLSVLAFNLSAQYEFNWGAGLGIHQVGSRYAPGLVVAPRVNIMDLSESASLSIGTKASLIYFSFAEGSRELPETRVGFDAPVFAMVNIGREANDYSIEQMGFVVGIGYSFGQMTLSSDKLDDVVLKSDGVCLMGGLRFQAFGNRSMGVNVSQTFGRGTHKESLNSLSVRLLYYFGEQ